MPDRMPEKTVRRYARYTARKNVRRLPDRQIACQRENQKIRQTDMPERMSEDMPDRMLEKNSHKICQIENLPEDMPDRMPERMSEDMPDRMPEQLTEDVPDKKCQCVDRCMVGCLRTRKSTSGYCVRLGGSTTKTSCKSQAAIALSSGEAEYYLLVSAACGALGEQSALKVGHLATNPVLDGFQYGMSHCIAAWVRPRQACGHYLFVGPRCSLQWSDRIGKETHD